MELCETSHCLHLGLPGEAGFISVKARRKSTDNPTMGVRTQGQMESADPPGKMDEKLKGENMQQRPVF